MGFCQAENGVVLKVSSRSDDFEMREKFHPSKSPAVWKTPNEFRMKSVGMNVVDADFGTQPVIIVKQCWKNHWNRDQQAERYDELTRSMN